MDSNVQETGATNTATPAVDTTKIVAERIKATREKDRSELAKAMGFESWDAAMNSGLDKKLLDAGIDPDTGKPIIENLVENHPDVVKAKEIMAEAQRAKQNADIESLNTQFGQTYKSIEDLDTDVKALLNKGLSIEQAFVAIHYKDLSMKTNPQDTARQITKQSVQHIAPIPGSGNGQAEEVVISQDEIDAVRRAIPNATIDQIKKFKLSHKGQI